MVALPFWIAGAGVLASLIGYFAVSVKGDDASQSELLHALHSELNPPPHALLLLLLFVMACGPAGLPRDRFF